MKNCIVLGSGRSGTSMVAGALAKSGYFMGDDLYGPRDANPKGFFEDPEINGINEDLLARVVPRRPPILGRWFFRDRPVHRQRWLARVPVGATIPVPPRLRTRIERAVARAPFCYKDPRFCYTLPAWRPHLANTAFLCVFRHPAATAASILKECRDASYLHSLKIDFAAAIEVWRLMHEHVLRIHSRKGDWLFVHFDQMIDGSAIPRIESLLGAAVDRTFAEPELRRSASDAQIPSAVRVLYEELCRKAEYDPS